MEMGAERSAEINAERMRELQKRLEDATHITVEGEPTKSLEEVYNKSLEKEGEGYQHQVQILHELMSRARIQMGNETDPEKIDQERLKVLEDIKAKLAGDSSHLAGETDDILSGYIGKKLEEFITTIDKRFDLAVQSRREYYQQHPDEDSVIREAREEGLGNAKAQPEVRLSNMSTEEYLSQRDTPVKRTTLQVRLKNLEELGEKPSDGTKSFRIMRMIEDSDKIDNSLKQEGLDVLGDTKVEK